MCAVSAGRFRIQVISMPFFELPVFSQCPRCIEEEEYALAEKAKDGEPKKRAGDKFYSLYAEWDALPDKESYRVGGGCWPIIEEVSDENG